MFTAPIPAAPVHHVCPYNRMDPLQIFRLEGFPHLWSYYKNHPITRYQNQYQCHGAVCFFVSLHRMKTLIILIACLIIIPCPVGGIDGACLGIPVFCRALNLRHLCLFIFRMIHLVMVFCPMVIRVIGTWPSHTCFCHNDTSCLVIVFVSCQKVCMISSPSHIFLSRFIPYFQSFP